MSSLFAVDLKQPDFMWNKIVDTSKLVLLVVITSLSNSYTLFEITINETDYTEIDCKWTWIKVSKQEKSTYWTNFH